MGRIVDDEFSAEFAAFGRMIATSREAARLSQAELAQRLAIPETELLEIEAGRQSITLGMLFRIAAELEVNPIQLLIPLDTGHLGDTE